MNKKYTFETNQFGINEEGIHLLRNRFNYKSIQTKEIESLELKNGKEFKNWILLLLLGIGMLTFAGYYVIAIISFFNDASSGSFYIEELLVPFLPTFIGAYLIYISFKNTINLIVRLRNKKFQFSMSQLIKDNKLEEFEIFIQENLNIKLRKG